MGVTELDAAPGPEARLREQLEAEQAIIIVVGIGAARDVLDLARWTAAANVGGRAESELIFYEWAGKRDRCLASVVVAGDDAGPAFPIIGRVLAVDENRAGDRVDALRRGLRTPENFNALDVPQSGGAELQLLAGDHAAVDLQRGSGPRTAKEARQEPKHAIRVLAANRGPGAAAEDDIGHLLEDLLDAVGAGQGVDAPGGCHVDA